MRHAPTRRLTTITTVVVTLAVLTATLPVVLILAAAVDLARWVSKRSPAMALRLAVFAWVYLLGEAWAIVVMAAVWLAGPRNSIEATYRLQQIWLDWNFDMLRILFRLSFRAEGEAEILPAPFLLLSRHASLIDTLLPGRYVVKPTGIRLRYVLKRELLIDPALDIGGLRLPNHFIDRRGAADVEIRALADLASGLGAQDAVLIYPEGTRYSEEKRTRRIESVVKEGGSPGEIAKRYRGVLPPRPAGTLALLESSEADVVVLAHRGLEGFANISEIWAGGLVGSTIDIRFWRIPRSQIPDERAQRVEWLYRTWAEMDDWVTSAKRDNRRHQEP